MDGMSASPINITPYLEDSSGYKGNAERVRVPTSLGELRAIVAECVAAQVPITIAGAGTGLTGARVPHGGWIISLECFRKLEVAQGAATCGAGVILSELQSEAAKTKQFFGPNPTENSASIGGIISTNAGGARSFRFGSVRRHILRLQVTFMNGRTMDVKLGDRVDFPYQTIRVPATTKNAAGYYLAPDLQWIDLLAGSEGTLGIVTEADLALLPEPAAILSGVVFFPSEDMVLDVVDEWRTISGLRLLESIDGRALDLLRSRYPEIASAAGAALLIEQDLQSDNDEEVDLWADRLANAGALEEASWFGFQAADRERFREFRHALPAMIVDRARRGNCRKFSSDFAVPLERNRDLYNYYRRRCTEVFPGQYTVFGHIGDANVHVNLMPDTADRALHAEELMEDFARYAVSLGGTVAAEHGIGKHKIELLKVMYSAEEINKMKDVKRVLDPSCLLGRGTIFNC